jgi:hypothetical protein
MYRLRGKRIFREKFRPLICKRNEDRYFDQFISYCLFSEYVDSDGMPVEDQVRHRYRRSSDGARHTQSTCVIEKRDDPLKCLSWSSLNVIVRRTRKRKVERFWHQYF